MLIDLQTAEVSGDVCERDFLFMVPTAGKLYVRVYLWEDAASVMPLAAVVEKTE